MFWSIVLCLLPVLIIGVGIYFLVTQNNEEGGVVLIVFGIAGCIVIFLTILFSRIDGKAQVGKYGAMQTTMNNQRKLNARFENATIALEIARMNKWLAKAKYKGRILSFWYPKEIYNIKPIR